MQPSHLLTDMKWATDRLGPERIKYAYAWKSFLDHHVVLAFGTDYPVELINPFRGLYSAITRQNEAGTQTFQPQEKISLNEAIYAYTQASAFGEFREKQRAASNPATSPTSSSSIATSPPRHPSNSSTPKSFAP